MAAIAEITKGYMTRCDVIWNRRQKIRSCSSWFLTLLLSFGYLQSSRAGSALDAFFDNLDSPSAFEDYFSSK
jgi:hypothetical protein